MCPKSRSLNQIEYGCGVLRHLRRLQMARCVRVAKGLSSKEAGRQLSLEAAIKATSPSNLSEACVHNRAVLAEIAHPRSNGPEAPSTCCWRPTLFKKGRRPRRWEYPPF